MRTLTLATLLVAGLLAGACGDPGGLVACRAAVPVDVGSSVPIPERPALDLLVVVGAMPSEGEHARRAAALVEMIEALVTGDLDGDGEPEQAGVIDLHLAVISAHLGSGGVPVPGCEPYDAGDDARFVDGPPGCAAGLPRFLTFRADSSGSSEPLVDAFACLATYAPACAIEQPLEAALRALSPRAPTAWTAPGYVPPDFGGETGHGDGPHEGFLRDRARLAILVVGGRDDCSARDPRLFTGEAPFAAESLERACSDLAGDALHPIERYVDGFLALRARPGLLSFGAVAGIPIDLEPGLGLAPDYERLASPDPAARDDRMEPTADPADPARLSPACTSPLDARATPANRLATLGARLEERGAAASLDSVCSDDYVGALFVPHVVNARPPFFHCLERTVPRRADATADCTLELRMPPGVACEDTPGATPAVDSAGPRREGGRAVCVLAQLTPSAADRAADRAPAGEGWYVDDYTRDAQMTCASSSDAPFRAFAYSAFATPGAGASLRCEVDVPSLGALCAEGPCGDGTACDEVQGACGIECEQDVDCALGGASGYRCDPNARGDIDPARFPGDRTPHGFCVSPTCG